MNNDAPIMFTIKEASEHYKLSMASVRGIAKSGAVHVVAIGKTGKKLLINKDSFDKYLRGE